jgi:hypothetical protein
VVGADRDGGSGRDGEGHVLEAEGHDGRGRAAVLAVHGEEPGELVNRLDRSERPPAAQAGVDRAGPFGRAETVAAAEDGERGARFGADLAHHPEGAGGDVGGMLLPGIPGRDDQRHDPAAQIGVGRRGSTKRVGLLVDRDATFALLGGQLAQRLAQQVSPDLPGLGQPASRQQHGQVRLSARAVETSDGHGVPPETFVVRVDR